METYRERLGSALKVLPALCQRWQVREFAFFGSVIHDDFHETSDVDVLVSFMPGAPWSLWDLIDMKWELEGLFGRQVDLVEKEALRNPIRKEAILSDRKVVYEAKEG